MAQDTILREALRHVIAAREIIEDRKGARYCRQTRRNLNVARASIQAMLYDAEMAPPATDEGGDDEQ